MGQIWLFIIRLTELVFLTRLFSFLPPRVKNTIGRGSCLTAFCVLLTALYQLAVRLSPDSNYVFITFLYYPALLVLSDNHWLCQWQK